ncbi:MAG TPA: RNA polymerase sigma factor [Saprospiraceae bacterium]|nr:RNA polymerase sigma factor [Saprospiraceae bacterium]
MTTKELKEMVFPYQDKLYRFAYSMVGNSFEAEDIVQEVLIKVWSKKDQFFNVENKEAWCMTITRNLAIDKIRSRKGTTHDIEGFFHLSDNAMSPAESVESDDMMSHLKKIIDRLPSLQRNLVHLRDIEGFSYKEISEITGESIDKVKINLHRARKYLREQLENAQTC